MKLDSRLPARFWQKVREGADGCWLWEGARSGGGGYGHLKIKGRMVKAHRFAYEALCGPIPDLFELDHLCRVRHCVNPDHLEPVTHRENSLRGVGWCAEQARKTHCKHGHAFTPENTYRYGASRMCKACRSGRPVAHQGKAA